MFKHIGGQSIFQMIVLLILVFNGETFIPEEADLLDVKLAKDMADPLRMAQLKKNGVEVSWKIKYSDSVNNMPGMLSLMILIFNRQVHGFRT